MNPICDLLGISIPILQAPTGSIAGPELCAAVSQVGGLGAMGVTWTPKELVISKIREVRRRTDLPFQVNFVLHFDPAGLDAAVEEGVPAITFSWGNPAPFLERARRNGAQVGVQVGSAAGAAYMATLGVDFIILQGKEAGGHVQGHDPLRKVLAETVELGLEIPIVAAGGLATAEDVQRVLSAGAQAAMLGTRFVATQESLAHDDYKRRLVEAESGETVLTHCFDGLWPDGAHRVIRNATFQTWEAAGCPKPGMRWGEGEVVAKTADGDPILRYESTAPRQGMAGEIDDMCLYAGTGVGSIQDCPLVSDLVAALWKP